MAKNEVFINGREIACKAAAGKSIAATPDVCFTPPDKVPPTPLGIPIPYPNTAFAKHTKKGSRTVKISGKPVILKNKSYFKTSTGNEPARPTAKKGVITGKVKGKAYFTSWSMNVKFERKNVCRHLDMTTHNHGSQSGNTAPWAYTDTVFVKHTDCEDNKKKVKKHCEVSEEENKKFKKDIKKKNKKRNKKRPSKQGVRDMTWKDKSCGGLMFKPSVEGFTNAKQTLMDTLDSEIADLNQTLQDKLVEITAEKSAKLAAKTAARHGLALFGGPFMAITQAIASVATVVDTAYTTVSGAIDAYNTYDEIADKVADFEKLQSKVRAELDELSQIAGKEDKDLTPEQKKIKNKYKQKANDLANAMSAKAKADPCLRARKCMLVPYNEHTGDRAQKESNAGCCPGQTAHHLIPKCYFHQSKGGDNRCSSYKEKKAPCVCVEGYLNSQGSHKTIHDYQDKIAKDYVENAGGKLSYQDAKDASLDSFQKTFPESGCDRKCLEAQLDDFHKECKDSDLRPVSAKGPSPLIKKPKSQKRTKRKKIA